MAKTNPDETRPSTLRARVSSGSPALASDAKICPACGKGSANESPSATIERCAEHHLALVAESELLACSGDPFLGRTVAERFVIVGRIGAGSMGTVYRAMQEAMGRAVAIKILRSDRALDSQAKARFQREARAMSLLTSPHTVTVFDFGEIPDDEPDDLGSGRASLYLAMEMLEGESLGQRLKRVRRLPVDDAVRIARHALLSLAEAHDKGVIHRDLKPDNLFLVKSAGSEEVCKVLDFGIAKLLSESNLQVDALETQAGTVFGTPRYMSPEQAQGRPLDARSDLYSLGVLLYQMLVGRAPFVDDDAVVVMARHIKTMPASPLEVAPEAGIGDALNQVVMRALAKDPNDRQPSARELIAELERAIGQPRRISSRPDGAAGSSGEVAALVRDDLESSPSKKDPARASFRTRTPVLVASILGAVAAVAFFELSFRHAAPMPEAAPAAPASIELAPPPLVHVEAPIATAMETGAVEAPPASASTGAKPTATPLAPGSASVATAPPKPLAPAGSSAKKPSPKKAYTRFE